MIEAILFDLDGTLLDRRATFRRHLDLQLARHPGVFRPQEASHYVARLLELDENGFLDRERFYASAEAEFNLAPGSAAVLKDDFEAHFPEECIPLPNVHETLRELRTMNIALGLITNGRGLIQGRKIRRLGLSSAFDVVVISDDFGYRKPDPRIFEHAVTQLGMPSAGAAYVGDNPEPDVTGAKLAGLHAIWRRDDFWPAPANADHVIDDLMELPPWVRARQR